MIDEPEIFVANDSPYRGVKPKQRSALADALRVTIAGALSKNLYVVDAPGENVLFLSIAATNLKLKKKKKSLLGYTPAGMVSGVVIGAATSDIAKKAILQEVVIEIEAFDSVTNERIVAIIDSGGNTKDDPTSWDDLEMIFSRYGRVMQCRFNNGRLPTEQRVNCLTQD